MPDSLGPYRRKRSPERTPEPFGGEGAHEPAGSRLFVVQKHAARRLHWDFRLELHGVLLSWAVPRGPSFDPAEKRLAVHVEDHPLDYAEFEGVIPPGNYGAGEVILWDRGAWIAIEDPDEGLRKGKLWFELRGYKLRGAWQLVRTKTAAGEAESKEWLLIKKPDAWAAAGGRAVGEESVLSGRTLDEMTGDERPAALREEAARLGALPAAVDLDAVAPMLAETAEAPFSAPGWLFELKYDGFRLLAARDPSGARLHYRKGSAATAVFPEIERAVASLPFSSLLLDGEVVVLDDAGRPSFERLQKRVHLERAADIARAAIDHPATLMLFDLLAIEGLDLRPLPLSARKELLRRVVPRAGPLRYADHVEERGAELFAEVRRLGLEGVIAKRADSPYRSGRSPAWLKVKADRTGDFVVVGFTQPARSRTGFGALHLALSDGATLVYAGRVGSGFDEATLSSLRATLDGLRRPKPACAGALAPARGDVWVEPRLVCEVRYSRFTPDDLVFHPVFLRMRDDKRPEECVRLRPAAPIEPPPAPATPEPPARKVSFTNLDKVFWPDEGYTKRDLIDYYRAVAPWMLPWLRGRPLVSTRFPDGIAGKSFYQHDAPAFVPGWFRTERIFSSGGSSFAGSDSEPRDVDYLICDDQDSLLYLANLATIPIHVWSSRAGSLGNPDWCVLDLDPKGAPFDHVVQVALAVRRLADEMGLPATIKTSGQAGLHVLFPLGAQLTHEQSRWLGELMARAVAAELPDLSTTARPIAARGGKVYLDYLQNGRGKTIAAPYCVRPRPGAPVSTPLDWSEVGDRLDPTAFTIKTVPARLKTTKKEPDLLHADADLTRAVAVLEARLRA